MNCKETASSEQTYQQYSQVPHTFWSEDGSGSGPEEVDAHCLFDVEWQTRDYCKVVQKYLCGI